MLNEIEKERFNNKMCACQVHISADIFVSPLVTERAAEVELTVPDDDYQKEMALYDRICQFALLYGEDLKGLFQNDTYQYISCFIHDISAFRHEFETEELLTPLFNHNKGETAMFVISFPETYNYVDKELVKKSFLDITQKHVITLDECYWSYYIQRVFSGPVVSVDFENERDNIIDFTREELVKKNLTESFEPELYVNSLFYKSQKIGEIDGYYVWFNERGFYFYWNEKTEYILESWLTFPAYPYGW